MTRSSVAAVGVNLLWLLPDAVGGTEEYATRLLAALAERPPEDLDVTLFALPSFPAAHPALAARFRTEVAPIGGERRPLRVAVESTWLALRARRRNLGLVHHMGGTAPVLRATPGLVTIHDLQPLLLPEHFGPVKRRWMEVMLPRSAQASVRNTGLVAAISDHTRDDLVGHLGVDPTCVRVITHGIDPIDRPAPSEVRRVQDHYRLGPRWFTYPAVTAAHKNHLMLLQAFASVAALDPEVQLVLTGAAGPAEAEVAEGIARHQFGERVRRTGRIPRADLDALISGAVALTFPSSFEGFGAPVLEAMALGCPVIASTSAALPEAVGAAGLLVDPEDPEEWARTMTRLLHHDEERRGLISAGYARAAQRGWDRSAAVLVDAWREALEWGR